MNYIKIQYLKNRRLNTVKMTSSELANERNQINHLRCFPNTLNYFSKGKQKDHGFKETKIKSNVFLCFYSGLVISWFPYIGLDQYIVI